MTTLPVRMSRRTFLSGAAALYAAPAARRPNIVLIVADDLGYGELSCQGNPEIPTPNIDSIAAQGVRFTSGYVSAPFCSPSRAGLMTGRYQTRFGHELNVIGKQNLLPHVGLPATEKTTAAHLKDLGYRTALIGKWHLGGTPPYHPLNRGFAEFFGFLHEGHFYVPESRKNIVNHFRPKEPPYNDSNPLMRGNKAIEEPRYLTTAFEREACGFIERNAKRPFFLYVPFNSVHSPMQAEPADVDRFAQIKDEHRRVFAGMLSSLDRAVGAILTTLKSKGLERDTIVVFLSDNGGPVQELTSSNAPLRGQKGQLFEGGIRIPFVMRWPGHIPAAQTISEPVISLDLLPTFLSAAGQAAPKNLDGVDLLPRLTGSSKTPPHAELYWRYGPAGALRQGRWKVVRQAPRGTPATWQLFDLEADLSEQTNLAEQDPARLTAMVARWEEIDKQMVPPTPFTA